MGSQPRVKWSDVESYWTRRGAEGFAIRRKGGDAILVAPAADGDHFLTHIVGHNSCNGKRTEVAEGHVSAIKRKYGVTREQLLGG